LSCAGEVLTNDEVAQRLEEADRVRKAAKKKKKGKASTAKQISQTKMKQSCESCGDKYSEEEAEHWIRCDACESWWHNWCGGLQSMLTEERNGYVNIVRQNNKLVGITFHTHQSGTNLALLQ